VTKRVPSPLKRQSSRPQMFIGSSVEGIGVARAIQAELEQDMDATLWNQKAFPASKSALDSLIKIADSFDAGVFVFSPDDLIKSRGVKRLSVRDNVLFECGIFFGKLGAQGSFFMVPRGISEFEVPSDLWGTTPLTYDPYRKDGNLRAAVGSACSELRDLFAGASSSWRDLSGTWRQEWHVRNSQTYPDVNRSEAQVRIQGNKFVASFSHPRGTFKARAHISNDRFVTGEWSNDRDDTSYRGAFQLHVSPAGNRMIGKWVGFKSDNRIAAGDWIWTRKS
jgi:hypothetical protein